MEDKSEMKIPDEVGSHRDISEYTEQCESNSHGKDLDTLLIEKNSIVKSNTQEQSFVIQKSNIQPLKNKEIIYAQETPTKLCKKSKTPLQFKVPFEGGEKTASNAIFRPNTTPPIHNMVYESILSNAGKCSKSKIITDTRLKSLEEEMTKLIKQCIEKEDTITSLEKQVKDSEQCRSEIQKKYSHLEQMNEKLQKTLNETTKKCDNVTKDLNATNLLMAEAKRLKKEMVTSKEDLQKQLAQALLQKEKLNLELKKLAQINNDLQAEYQREVTDRKTESTFATKQKKELVEVVMKQMQLCNNLRRQILHLKAGIAQKFTENEVMNAVENTF